MNVIGYGSTSIVFSHDSHAIKVKFREDDKEWFWMVYVSKRFGQAIPQHVPSGLRLTVDARHFFSAGRVPDEMPWTRLHRDSTQTVYLLKLGRSLAECERLSVADSASVALQLILVFANFKDGHLRHNSIKPSHVLLVPNHRRRVIMRWRCKEFDMTPRHLAYPIDFCHCERRSPGWTELERLMEMLSACDRLSGLSRLRCGDDSQLTECVEALDDRHACSVI